MINACKGVSRVYQDPYVLVKEQKYGGNNYDRLRRFPILGYFQELASAQTTMRGFGAPAPTFTFLHISKISTSPPRDQSLFTHLNTRYVFH
jgi:hypothetical protein